MIPESEEVNQNDKPLLRGCDIWNYSEVIYKIGDIFTENQDLEVSLNRVIDLACDSCGGQYESGFLTEIEGLGLFCHHCFKPTFAEYFTKHPEADYLLIRGVSSLAYRRKGKDV